jgi:hypothetical protein
MIAKIIYLSVMRVYIFGMHVRAHHIGGQFMYILRCAIFHNGII